MLEAHPQNFYHGSKFYRYFKLEWIKKKSSSNKLSMKDGQILNLPKSKYCYSQLYYYQIKEVAKTC